MPNHATEDQHQEGNEVVKVQIGYGEEHGFAPAPKCESKADGNPIFLTPSGLLSDRDNRACALQLTFDRRRKVWEIHVPESGIKILPKVANSFEIEMTGL